MQVFYILCLSLVTVFAMPTRVQAFDDAAELVEFRTRVEAYMSIHHRLVRASQQMRPTSDPANIRAAQQQLASRIRAVRYGAEQGDILTAPIETIIRARLNRHVPSNGTDETGRSIGDDGPMPFALTANGAYPVDAAFETMPPNVLAALPSLPGELEFRIVGTHLILHDVHANIVVDYISDVM